ncbi:hypothetical protein BG003_011923 [Podila horticola]|nr:hypothetical protein BG003_011923 [Podila horticola]
MADTSSTNGATIELTLQNLSLTVIPYPSLLTRTSRQLKHARNPAQNLAPGAPTFSKTLDEEPTSPSSIERGGNSGISIFRCVDLTLKPGQVCIVLGGSGSGKTTLLSAIAGRMNTPDVIISGSIRCNGIKAKKFWNDGSIGYLQQRDFLMPFLTVRETLTYAAHLRLPRTMSSQHKKELVELVLIEMGLKDCVDMRIGDPGGGEHGSGGIRGISGGERRRVSAAVQLLTNPKMLLCDEVTSGLDSFSSFEVMKSFTKLAKSSQKTIVISIHQPRSEIFKLLTEYDNQMVLLSRGDVVYSGPVNSVLPWFESLGIGSCPIGVNPLDFLLDLSMIDFANEAIEKPTAVRRDWLVRAWADREQSITLVSSPIIVRSPTDVSDFVGGGEGSKNVGTEARPSFMSLAVDIIPKGSEPGLWSQIRVLTSRGWINQCRDRTVIWGSIGECILIGLVVSAIFFQIDRTEAGIRSRSSLIYVVGALHIYLMLMIMIYHLSPNITLYDRERIDRWYGPLPHLVSGILFSAPHNILYSVGLSTGFFEVTISIPVWLRWIKYLAYPNLCYSILASNEFTDNRFSCPYYEQTGVWDPIRCAKYDGNIILVKQLGLKTNYFPDPIAYMACYFFGFLFVAWTALSFNIENPTTMGSGLILMDVIINQAMEFITYRKTADTSIQGSASVTSSDVKLDIEKAQMKETRLDVFSRGLERKDPVTISVEGLSLSVFSSQFSWSFSGFVKYLRNEKRERLLLKDVDVVFPAGELTAILGGSGSGKTSLLNVLLHRASSNHKIKGAIYFNDTKNPSLQMINCVSAYVRQDDNFLLSHLTVRETLQYAAELKMDHNLNKQQKHSKVDDNIDLFGLRECADVIIGNDAVKGCSGGQRRRVSIGMQLVTEPACLFLDEPTTGLDALTAKAVVLTLKQIADSGRTVVCTIHQPRADIWNVFDNIVLLVTGGRAAYSGRADSVVDYFKDADHVAPAFTNVPARAKTSMLKSQIPAQPMGELKKVNLQFAHFGKAFPLLTRRSFVNTIRRKGLYFNRIFQPVMAAIILPLELFASLGATVFMLVLTGMHTTVSTFFSFWAIMFGYINTGESIELIFSTLASHDGFNITITSAVLGIFSYMTGFMSLNMPQFLEIIKYISMFKYGSLS